MTEMSKMTETTETTETTEMSEMTETIAAVATPPGTGALAVIRVSGPGAREVLAACTRGRRPEPRRATLLRVRDAQDRVIDEVVATFFAAPASFTGEDVVELSCHGGLLVTKRVLERLFACGARPAEPGEFSRRAFENGRMDLTQAEAVMDIISAGSDLALRAAQNQLQGAICRRVEAAVNVLTDVAAHTVAFIDFPDEDIEPAALSELLRRLELADAMLAELLATADEGRVLREGIRTAIVGAPNVGKSSLLNCLLGYERAIVSDTAGTTRDTIEESLRLGGLCLHLIDTAGLHESGDALEQAGMERSKAAGASADLLIEVVDASQAPVPLPPELQSLHGARHLLLLNKCDLPMHPLQEKRGGIRFSCRSGEGRAELEAALQALFLHESGESDSFAAINSRHRYALVQAREALARAKEALRAGESPEFVDVDLQEALEALGAITGKTDTEDILSRVFATFCLGK